MTFAGTSSNRLIIAFSGKAGSGKSTLAKMFKQYMENRVEMERTHLPVIITSFADELRKECNTEFPDTDWFEKPTPPLTRKMLQAWGQLRRIATPNYWVHAWAKGAPQKCIVLVDDLRFENEAMYLRTEETAVLVRIHTPDNPLTVAPDVSETALDRFDYWDLELEAEYGNLSSLLDPIWQHLRNRGQRVMF